MTEHREQIALLNCPFCGGDGRLTYMGFNSNRWAIGCSAPGCFILTCDFVQQSDAIAAWNRRNLLDPERERLIQERDAARAALTKIDAIRNSIIGCQRVNWSEHVYPLVAALGEAGYEGVEYEDARENVGTLIERTNAAEALVKRLCEALGTVAQGKTLAEQCGNYLALDKVVGIAKVALTEALAGQE